ncbi:hypothetical protein [Pokkaliibacter plantistimulans]|uniref:hypothetical protein n=1 Tax=Pokkaliibacter plantistimulans TaxID=1635171 RepID=UPI0011B0C3AC|nr:hypothetical protein [Pokkaliibacter plantistimulans]
MTTRLYLVQKTDTSKAMNSALSAMMQHPFSYYMVSFYGVYLAVGNRFCRAALPRYNSMI